MFHVMLQHAMLLAMLNAMLLAVLYAMLHAMLRMSGSLSVLALYCSIPVKTNCKSKTLDRNFERLLSK